MSNVMQYLKKNGGSFEDAYAALYSVTPDAEMERLHHYWE
jgi:hypothetical protein